MSETEPRIAILASGDRKSGGGGSTANQFARDVLEGKVGLTLGVVICNNPPGTVGVYGHFEKINSDFGLKGDDRIDVVNIGPNTHPGRPLARGQTLDESSAVCRLLEERGIDFAVMLGFMRILTGELVETWGWRPEYGTDDRYSFRNGLYHPNARISNNHPSILPFTADTHGNGAHEEAIKLYRAGRLTHSVMTWQLATEEVDGGPIINEVPVPIEPEDDAGSLGDKIQFVEKRDSAEVIAKHTTLRAQHLLAA